MRKTRARNQNKADRLFSIVSKTISELSINEFANSARRKNVIGCSLVLTHCPLIRCCAIVTKNTVETSIFVAEVLRNGCV